MIKIAFKNKPFTELIDRAYCIFCVRPTNRILRGHLHWNSFATNQFYMERGQQMAALIEGYPQSGQSLKTFCLQNQISYHTFQYWRYRKKRLSNKQGAFIAVHANLQPSSGKVEIAYPNGVSVRLGCFDSHQISELLKSDNV